MNETPFFATTVRLGLQPSHLVVEPWTSEQPRLLATPGPFYTNTALFLKGCMTPSYLVGGLWAL